MKQPSEMPYKFAALTLAKNPALWGRSLALPLIVVDGITMKDADIFSWLKAYRS